MSRVRTEWNVKYHVEGDVVIHFSKIGNYDAQAQREFAERAIEQGVLNENPHDLSRNLIAKVVEVIELNRPNYA